MEGMTNGASSAGGLANTGGSGANGATNSGASGAGSQSATPASQEGQTNATQAPAQGNGSATPAPGQAETSVTEPKKWKLKAYDQEVEIDDITKLERLAQKGFGAEQSLRLAAEERQRAQAVLEAFKDKARLREIMKEHGIDPADFGRETLQEAIERRQLEETNPDRLKAMELEKKIQQMEAEKQRYAEEREAAELESFKQAQAQHYEQLIMKSLEKGNLPRDGETLRRAAREIYRAKQLAGIDLHPDEIAEAVFDSYRAEHAAIYPKMDDNLLARTLGDDVIERCAKIYAAKVKSQVSAPNPPETQPMAQTNGVERMRMTREEFYKKQGWR